MHDKLNYGEIKQNIAIQYTQSFFCSAISWIVEVPANSI